MQLRYDENKDKVFNLLLLFNIATLNERPQEAVKFSFANLHINNWNVEHISPQNPKKDLKKAIEPFSEDENLKKLFDENKNIIEEAKAKFIAVGEEFMWKCF